MARKSKNIYNGITFQVMFKSGRIKQFIAEDVNGALKQAEDSVVGTPLTKEVIVQVTKIEKTVFDIAKSGKKYKVTEQ